MRDQATRESPSQGTIRRDPSGKVKKAPPLSATCEWCSKAFTPVRQSKARFCSRPCYWEWWKERGQAEASARGLKRLDELRKAGRDPRSTEQAAWKRKMAFRNTALSMVPEDPEDDDLDWAERGDYWEAIADPPVRTGYRARKIERRPLVLAGHGVRMRIHYGALVVRHGFTHYPQKAKEQRFFPGQPGLPSRIILLDPDGSITIDVVAWLARRRIPLVMLDWRGRVVNALGWEPRAADPELRQAQLEALANGVGLRIATELIIQKLRASTETLRTSPPSNHVAAAIPVLQSLVGTLRHMPPGTIDEIRLLEARGAAVYFGAWQGLAIAWKGTGRRPIPPEWRRMPSRHSFFGGSNRHASHPVGALLNYGYAVVEGLVRTRIAGAGLDPELGYLHARSMGRASLLYDVMEPARPIADRLVLDLVRRTAFHPGDFIVTEPGVCRLHPELARALASKVGASCDREDVVPQVVDLLSSRAGQS